MVEPLTEGESVMIFFKAHLIEGSKGCLRFYTFKIKTHTDIGLPSRSRSTGLFFFILVKTIFTSIIDIPLFNPWLVSN